MQVVVNNLMTRYELRGSGKLVLLLHGWGDNAQGLDDLQEKLIGKYKVVSLDLPGFGATQPPQSAWNLDDYAEFVAAFLKKLKLKPYAVIGHSNGGALAIRAISLGTIHPQKLVLLAASGIRARQSGKRLALKLVAKVGNVATLWLPERYRRALRSSLYDVAGSDALVVPALRETFALTVRQDVQADAAKLSLPTLLIYGQDDTAVPVADGRTYKKIIAHSQLVVMADAGHFVHLDQPAHVVTNIKEFLA